MTTCYRSDHPNIRLLSHAAAHRPHLIESSNVAHQCNYRELFQSNRGFVAELDVCTANLGKLTTQNCNGVK